MAEQKQTMNLKCYLHINDKKKRLFGKDVQVGNVSHAGITKLVTFTDDTPISEIVGKMEVYIKRYKQMDFSELLHNKIFLTLPRSNRPLQEKKLVTETLKKQKKIEITGREMNYLWVRCRPATVAENQDYIKRQETIAIDIEKKKSTAAATTMTTMTSTATAAKKNFDMTRKGVEDWFKSFKDPNMTYWAEKFLFLDHNESKNCTAHAEFKTCAGYNESRISTTTAQYLKNFTEDDFREHAAVYPFCENFWDKLEELREKNGWPLKRVSIKKNINPSWTKRMAIRN